MYYAIIDSASLRDPAILNEFKHLKVTVQYEPHSTVSKYHYIFLLQFSDETIDTAIATFQKETLPSWYTFFWSDTVLNIVFDTKVFKIDLPNGWTSQQYTEAQKFGASQEIPQEYLDFQTHFRPYQEIAVNFKN